MKQLYGKEGGRSEEKKVWVRKRVREDLRESSRVFYFPKLLGTCCYGSWSKV